MLDAACDPPFPIFVQCGDRTVTADSSLNPEELAQFVSQTLEVDLQHLFISTHLGKPLSNITDWRDIHGYYPDHLSLNANHRLRGGGPVISFCRGTVWMGNNGVESIAMSQGWNDDGKWKDEDEDLLQIVEVRQTRADLNYDQIVTKWRHEEWSSIADELYRKAGGSGQKRPWKEVKQRFKKIIVQKFDKQYPITKEDMLSLRSRLEEEIPKIIKKVVKKEVENLEYTDIPIELPADNRYKSQGIYASGKFDTRYGITEAEWDALSEEEQEQIKAIRNLVWSFSHHLKSQYPQGSLMRNFWTLGIIRKKLLIKYATLTYERESGNIITKVREVLLKMKTY